MRGATPAVVEPHSAWILCLDAPTCLAGGGAQAKQRPQGGRRLGAGVGFGDRNGCVALCRDSEAAVRLLQQWRRSKRAIPRRCGGEEGELPCHGTLPLDAGGGRKLQPQQRLFGARMPALPFQSNAPACTCLWQLIPIQAIQLESQLHETARGLGDEAAIASDRSSLRPLAGTMTARLACNYGLRRSAAAVSAVLRLAQSQR